MSSQNNRRFSTAVCIIIALCYLTVIINLIYLLVPCPLPEDYILAQKKCNIPLRTNLFYASLGFKILTKVAMFILPFPIILELIINKD